MTAALCVAATCSAVSSTSTGELHERVCAPFTLAEQLGSGDAAAHYLCPTWPSLRKAVTRHGFGMRTRNPQARRAEPSVG
jgi:hypothetical protein